ncbi:MAG: hydrogenase expression/formation protein HypE [Firmicutes bacterium]|jgi:hydrogenase expression/formation protein HypE|nr:hydrogenase expression/formation protein HypE [Bacillota bacterium]
MPLAKQISDTKKKFITMPVGSGGKATKTFINTLLLPRFANARLNVLGDGALLDTSGDRLAFTTDSFVVSPLIFPGGSIGDLAVNGTLNDLAACGAKPLALSLSLILEEGLSLVVLEEVLDSIQAALNKAGVEIVTGDTKVVEKGKADGCYINTSGIGIVHQNSRNLGPKNISVGDDIIVTGPIGDHGTAIMLERGNLGIEADVKSDTVALAEPLGALMDQYGLSLHAMRDPTRGGLATVLNEMAESSNVGIEIDESQVPVRDEVRAVADLLGIDPLYIASEGRMVIFVNPEETENIVKILKSYPESENMAVIGKAVAEHPGFVLQNTSFGGQRIIDLLTGDPLPRIC